MGTPETGCLGLNTVSATINYENLGKPLTLSVSQFPQVLPHRVVAVIK